MPIAILIVDDDLDDVQIFKEGVSGVNPAIECYSADDGEKALHLLKSGEVKPDYIFLDLNMPRLDGKQLLLQLKQDARLSNIPVIIYTTSRLVRDKEETKALGADYFITKPTSLTDLHDAISFVLSEAWKKIPTD